MDNILIKVDYIKFIPQHYGAAFDVTIAILGNTSDCLCELGIKNIRVYHSLDLGFQFVYCESDKHEISLDHNLQNMINKEILDCLDGSEELKNILKSENFRYR